MQHNLAKELTCHSAPVIHYIALKDGKTNSTLDDLALKYGNDMAEILAQGARRDGGEPHSYVNYAYGGEGPEAWYGKEPWRLEKLLKLKSIVGAFGPH